MDLVYEGFDGVLIFCGVRFLPLCEDGVFTICDVTFETWFLLGVGVLVSIPGLTPAGTSPSLLLRLGFVPRGDVLDLDALFVIRLRRLPSCSP